MIKNFSSTLHWEPKLLRIKTPRFGLMRADTNPVRLKAITGTGAHVALHGNGI